MNTRILLIDMPRLMREIVETAVRRRPDLIVAGALAHEVGRDAEPIDTSGADVVVLNLGSAEVLLRLLEQRPAKPLVLIGRDGGAMFRCEPLGELSPLGLLDMLAVP
ncbi:hypothetical protein [Saccharopolyspora taberi]|uniref:DNA-binding response regulator n=1 Tax=Saccharopolyspora taberi TaxID=60895 RepID=A0ABN3VAF5_9PSEU